MRIRALEAITENPVFIRELGSRRMGKKLWLFPVFNGIITVIVFLLYGVFAIRSRQYPNFPEWKDIFSGVLLCVGGMQYLAIVYILPARIAGCIAREREMQTLDFVLLTPLTPSQVMWGKTCAAFAPFALSLAAVFPLCFLAPLVQREVTGYWIGFAIWALLALLLLVSSFTYAAISAHCRRAATAIALSYTLVLFFCPNPVCGCGFAPFMIAGVLLEPRTRLWGLLAAGVTLLLFGSAFFLLIWSALKRLRLPQG